MTKDKNMLLTIRAFTICCLLAGLTACSPVSTAPTEAPALPSSAAATSPTGDPDTDPAVLAAEATIAAQLTLAANPQTPTAVLAGPAPTALNLFSAPLPSAPPAATAVEQLGQTPVTPAAESTTPEAPANSSVQPQAVLPSATTSSPPAGSASTPSGTLVAPSWQDTFQSGDNWPLYSDQHAEMTVGDGALQMRSLNADQWESWIIATVEAANLYAEMTAQPDACSGLDRYGLVVRAVDVSRGYVFGLSCDGRYSLRTYDGVQFATLVDWKTNPAILAGAGQVNRLGIKAEGDRLTLYANGVTLEEIQNSAFSQGEIGVFISSANTPGFTVRVADITLWVLP